MYFSLLSKSHYKCVARLLAHHRQMAQIAASHCKALELLKTGAGADTRTTSSKRLEESLVYPIIRTFQRNYCSTKQETILEADDAIVESASRNEDEEIDAEMTISTLKSLLYADESDELMRALNSCRDHKELLVALTQNADSLQRQHHVQTIILLWTYYRFAADQKSRDQITQALSKFKLKQLLRHVSTMNSLELSCCYLYLHKMGVPNADDVLQALLLRALYHVESSANSGNSCKEFPLPLGALSRLVVGINSARDFHTPTVCAHFIPHLDAHVHSCVSMENARLIAVCMRNLQPLIGLEMLEDFKLRVGEMLISKDFPLQRSDTSKSLYKLLSMFNLSSWSLQNTALIRKLMLALQPQVVELNDVQLRMVCRIFQHHLEPAKLAMPLRQATAALLQRQSSVEALVSYMPFTKPSRREPLITLFKRLLEDDISWQQPNASGNFFSVLRTLKVSDARLCNAYWKRVLHELDSCREEQTHLRFLRHCHRYMNFNNNLGGTYRHSKLEQRLSAMAMQAIETDMAGRVPVKFARLASFVLAYGHTPHSWKKFPNIVLSKIISMAPQFSIGDCFMISRGLQVAIELRFRHFLPSLLGMQVATIDSILVTCAERHLSSNEGLTANDLNLLVRSLSFRKSLKNTVVFQEALKRYKQLDASVLNSRIIRDMAYNFNTANFCEPKSLEAMFDYIEQNHEHVLGDTVEKVLSCAYNLGYTPQSQQVLEYAGSILMRDFDNMSGFSIVQACLSLCFYKSIPEELINKVFCVKFIQRIEDEIQTCYSKATYPERVLNMVMQLNRTVCLDFPEANVPWFQQNYLEAQLSKKPYVQNNFSEDVKNLLLSLLKDNTHFRCNHTTPYGYQIDFVIHFDKNKKPIPAPLETTMLDRITKVAILLLKLDSFCDNNLMALRGPDSLKIKHLEMMGYKVLHINEHDWNSKYMNAPSAKANYLKCLLQISN